MIPLRIAGQTRYLGPPENFEQTETRRCVGLSIRDVVHDGVRYMVSRYEPTPDELERLNAGQPVELWIAGTSHPMIAIQVPDAEG